MPKLTKPAAIELRDAEVEYLVAKAELDDAKAKREQVRAKHAERLPYDEPVDAGGYRLVRKQRSSGERFRLSEYLKAHPLTAAMRPFVSSSTYDALDIKPIAVDVPSLTALVEAARRRRRRSAARRAGLARP
jgi:hypothetical protein